MYLLAEKEEFEPSVGSPLRLICSQGRLTLNLQGFVLQRNLLADILRVGAVACLSPVQSVLAILIFTGLLAQLGTEALAGYGIGQRLEFLLIPISFGIGVAAVPMVGMAMGAGQVARARRVAWVAAGVSALNLGVIGAVVTLAPNVWARLFSQEEAVLTNARQYLETAGPAFPFFGLGLTLYFASQGAGQVIGPVLAGTVRLVLVAGAGLVVGATPGCGRKLLCLGGVGHAAVWLGHRCGCGLHALDSHGQAQRVNRKGTRHRVNPHRGAQTQASKKGPTPRRRET